MRRSIISNHKVCLICGKTTDIHRHHIFFNARKKCDEWGCWCYLCSSHHNMSKYSVHHNRSIDLSIKVLCQKKFEELWGHDKFMELFHKDFIATEEYYRKEQNGTETN